MSKPIIWHQGQPHVTRPWSEEDLRALHMQWEARERTTTTERRYFETRVREAQHAIKAGYHKLVPIQLTKENAA